nr:hypothetical protein CFP56_39539 [Quercus suber]
MKSKVENIVLICNQRGAGEPSDEEQNRGRTKEERWSSNLKRNDVQRQRSDEEQRTEEEQRTLELRSGRLNEECWLIERWSDLQCQRTKKNNAGSEEHEE